MKLRTWGTVALLCAVAAATSAASLAITRASWSGEKLYVSGTAPSGQSVTIANASTGVAIGTAKVENNGRWKAVFENLARVPCRVRATQGTAGIERAVSGTPSNCDGGTTKSLTALSITGPATVAEGGTATFAATATFSDNTTQNVTAAATWTENSGSATIAGGVLTTGAVSSDQTVLISSSYTSGTTTRTATKSVTLQNAPAGLTALSISGPATVLESSSATYAAIATFSDNTTQNVTAIATWSDSSSFASIAAGVLTTAAVSSDQAVTISSSYTSSGVTRTATLSVALQNVPDVTGSHAGRFPSFEGTKTCLTCHIDEAKAFHGSVHYQWLGDASESEGLGGAATAGKMGGINDFCIYPDINWLGKLKAADPNNPGQVLANVDLDGGCARCHTGLGKKPTATLNPSQGDLENIDCLICHSPNYKRKVDLVNGVFTLVPDTAKMTVSLLQAAVDLRLPGKDACLNCHTKAGGGDNFKRGDISEAHRNATTALDVHMAPSSQGGAGLECTGCHTTSAHRMAGRGVDMRQRDSEQLLECSNCHSNLPHDSSRLNSHTTRVACNVCHVPTFAKGAPTDMRRDWSQPGVYSAVARLMEPHMEMQSNVTPVYRFFNGRSRFYGFGTAAVPQANGLVLMAGPLGSRAEPGAKITAMKRHTGSQPIEPVTGRLLPLKIGIFFQTGNLTSAVTEGAAALGWPLSKGYEFAETERYMGVYHEVAPASQALSCSSCHGGTRLNFAELGYKPNATRNGKPLCASCHDAKSGNFTFIHEKHVTDKRIDCINCHTFSKG